VDAEWDEKKRLSNIAKHGIDFADAATIFDGYFVELLQRQREYGEERIGALGRLEEEILFVVYTWRGERRRIISARRARRDERKKYYQNRR
jgi:uncharacterized DUF497 family protein